MCRYGAIVTSFELGTSQLPLVRRITSALGPTGKLQALDCEFEFSSQDTVFNMQATTPLGRGVVKVSSSHDAFLSVLR